MTYKIQGRRHSGSNSPQATRWGEVQGPFGVRASALALCTTCFLFAFALTTPASLGAAARPRYGGTLRLSFFQAGVTFDPALAATLPERTVCRAVYETLVNLDDDGAPVPGLAANWQSESSGKRWVFQIRGGALSHNGSPLTAATVRASLERAIARAQTAAAAHLRRVRFLCASPAPTRLACDMAEPLAALPAMLADPALAIADADGAGTGPWKIAGGSKGASVRLEAFEGHPQGRPFLDAVEAEFGADARRQRIEFELKRVDAIVAAPAEPRPPGLVRAPPPSNLLLVGFPPPSVPARTDRADLSPEARRALFSTVNREALAHLLPPGRADPADGLLPGWLSGYELLFAPAAAPPPSAASPVERREYHLIYDDSDPVARLIASRLALDLRPAGATVRPEGLSRAAFRQALEAGRYSFYLESVRLRSAIPGVALADLLERFDPAKAPLELFPAPGGIGASVELQYGLERAALETARAIPLLRYRDVYSFQPGIAQVPLDPDGLLDLANAWKK